MNRKKNKAELTYLRPVDMCSPDPNWYSEKASRYWCQSCVKYRISLIAEDSNLYLETPPSKADMHAVWYVHMLLASKKLIALFSDVCEHLNLGRVYNCRKGREELVDKVALSAKSYVVVRGLSIRTKHYGKCAECGIISYISDFPWYVLRQSLSEAKIYLTWPTIGILVSKELADRIDRKQFKRIKLFDVPVYDVPQDEFDLPLTIEP